MRIISMMRKRRATVLLLPKDVLRQNRSPAVPRQLLAVACV
jgi:hypothetical protein